ncbi:orotidine-5'-phosphate decarboxylase [Candidatus Uhrbacteria bacterium]|nr:orotidine-5'-phosphate decarboxylase [Candidatus Uhrbacteria bacterium]
MKTHPLKNLPAAERLIVALDVPPGQIQPIAIACLQVGVKLFKLGPIVLDAIGVPAAVHLVEELGGKVMIDQNRYDIPDVMRGSARVLAGHKGVNMFTVHASAKVKGLKAAVDGAGESCYVIGVTVLTSFSEQECQEQFGRPPPAQVAIFCKDLVEAGVPCVVCSPKELKVVRGTGLVAITPGVRPVWAPANDHKRTTTPGEAIHAGAEFLVVGRPITDPPKESGMDTREAAIAVVSEIERAMTRR